MDTDFLLNIRCFLLDMDGTLYLSERPIQGALAFIKYLTTTGIEYYCLTNNSSSSQGDYYEKLARLGFEIPSERILTSGDATADLLNKENPGGRIFVVGTPSLESIFESRGFKLVLDDPDTIVLGFDTGLTYEKLEKLCKLVREGYEYVATHPDLNCPTDEGPIPDIGATIAFVKTATGRVPDRVIGKPNRPIVEIVANTTGISLHQICMVGDRLYTDIAVGQHGLKTVLVLSGETKSDDVPTSEFTPDLVVVDLGKLHEILEKLHA
jgi:HAD superfamily hydrolase (TIGR01450 family)